MTKILVTGGAGFIGSNFIRLVLACRPNWEIINLDKLTYAGNRSTIEDIKNDHHFVQGDICDAAVVEKIVKEVDGIIHFAAESHVDNSILDPGIFEQTNVRGTLTLLNAAKERGIKFLQVSTDEVYGSIERGSFKESDAFHPRSPYAATKAAAELLVHAYHETYGLPTLITRSSNNYGPFHYPEKVIPLFVTNLVEGLGIPLYGTGEQVRDWMFVEDNCRGILTVFEKGNVGDAYNIASKNELTNKELARKICKILGKDNSCILPWPDRKGHDFRYSVDTEKIEELGWKPNWSFEDGLNYTIEWFKKNEAWWKELKIKKFGSDYKKLFAKK